MNKIIGVILLVFVYFLAKDVLKKVSPEEQRAGIKLAKVRTGGATLLLLMLAIFHFVTDLSFCEFYPSFCNRFPGFCESFPFLCR